MSEPRIVLAWFAMALGTLMVVVSFVSFWLGLEPAWFAVTGLVWGSILCTVCVALVWRQRGSDEPD